jgi:hypothetical protein
MEDKVERSVAIEAAQGLFKPVTRSIFIAGKSSSLWELFFLKTRSAA